MLSLRDTGRFNGTDISVITTAGKCNINVPFSVSEFIRRKCSEIEKSLKFCVVLFRWSPPDIPPPKFVQKDKGWYENYFLNWENPGGIAHFWYKESFGKLKFEGKVLDWTLVQKDAKDVLDKDNKSMNRNTALDIAKNIALSKNESPGSYDGFIAVVDVDTSKYIVQGDNSGTGSTFAIGIDHNHTCHEIGHIIGNISKLFTHSFGLETKEYRGGVYGYPYCIMSAEWYGGAYGYFTPTTALTPEEGNRGPGLCGGTRAMLGWANTIDFNLDDEKEGVFEIQSLGSNHNHPQVLLITKDGRKFFVEYRSASDENDKAISSVLNFDAVVVVGIISGGIAAGEQDGRHTTNGTFIGQIPLNFASSLPDTIINFEPDWGIKVIGIKANLSLVIQVVKNFTFSLKTYRRTHDIALSDGSSSFQVDGSLDYSAKCDLYEHLREWRLNGQPIRSLRDLINT